jgi:hypothetical protein
MMRQFRSPWLGVGLSLSLLGFALVREATAQNQLLANPTDLTHPWISNVNPAVIPFQNSQIALGIKILHWGFLQDQTFGLRENGFNISFPFLLPQQIGFGFDVRQFHASVYSEIAASALVGKEIYNRLAVGVKLGIEQRSLDRSKFNLVDPNDPLLQAGLLDQYKLNTGAGLFWNPGQFTAGIAVDHLNRANVARSGKFLLPPEFSGAMSYSLGIIVPSVIVHRDGLNWNVGFALAAVKPKLGMLRLGYENTLPIKLEAELNLSRNSKLDYAYDFATAGTRAASMGSHQLTFNHVFGRAPEIGDPVLFASTNALNILIETITRSTPAQLPPQVLAAVTDLAPDYLASAPFLEDGAVVITAGKLREDESMADTQNRYRTFAVALAGLLREHPDSRIIMRADAESAPDAEALERFLNKQLGLVFSEDFSGKFRSVGKLALEDFKPGYRTVIRKEPRLSSERVTFDLQVPGRTRHTQSWLFKITGPNGQAARVFSGKGNLPSALEWDWRNAKGRVVAPGIYQCRLILRTKSGKVKAAAPVRLAVYLTRRNVNMKFYEKPALDPLESTSENLGQQKSDKPKVVRR